MYQKHGTRGKSTKDQWGAMTRKLSQEFQGASSNKERETTNKPFEFFIVQKHVTYKLFNNVLPAKTAKTIYYVQN